MQVLVVSPPNSNTVIDGASCTVTKPEEHTDWSDFPNLGVLSLVSALEAVPGVEPVYVDATVLPWPEVLRYIEDHAGEILAVCISALTATYEAGLQLCAAAKRINSKIVTVIGNDHVTALAHECMSAQRGVIDYAFVGNEVVNSFVDFIAAISIGRDVSSRSYPGLTYFDGATTITHRQQPEPVYTQIDHEMIDHVFHHSGLYQQNFSKRIAPVFKRLTGRAVTAGVPVEIGRGCIKFARNDACSFCSIQYGGMWRNAVSGAAAAWKIIESAHARGYDYLYLTADELPLTFGKLLREMVAAPPAWWTALGEDERPVMVGYARADGLSDERHAANLRALGVRQLMVGLDAGTAVSLHAMNNLLPPLAPIRDIQSAYRAEKMFDHNVRALRSAKNSGLLLKVGFVIGHVGMDEKLLRENVESMKALLASGAGSIASLDVEVLSPEPGSLDFAMLLDPDLAVTRADALGLQMPERAEHERCAKKWRGVDIIDREEAMTDYVVSVMPGLTLHDLAEARAEVRNYGQCLGLTIGEQLVSLPLLLGFAGLCLLLAITPGPETFLVLRCSLGGARPGIAAAIGSGIGSLWWAAMVALGLAALLEHSAAAFLVVKAAGGLYLLYLGIIGFIRRGRGTVDTVGDKGSDREVTPVSTRTALRSGVFSCALNPKVGLFFLAVVPQFLPAHAIGVGPTMVLGAIDGIVAVLWLTLFAIGSAKAVGWLRKPKFSRRLEQMSSGVLVALGIGTLASTA